MVSRPPTPTIPKAKNPELQEAFENAYKWGEAGNKRLLLSMRKAKNAQEENQWRSESERFLAKASEYPPYQGLGDKFSLVDRGLDDQLKAAEDKYNTELEQLIARFATAAKPATTSYQDPVISALEAKLEKISQLAATQTQQIQDLLSQNQSCRSSVLLLETGYKSIELCHNDLKAKYSTLESDHDAFKSRFREYDNTINALQLRQANIDAENKSLKKQLEELRSTSEKSLGSSQAQLSEDKKAFQTVLERIKNLEVKLDDFKDFDEIKYKLDELDPITLNEICDAWVSTEYNLKTQYEEYSQRHRQNGSSVDDTLRSLRQELDSLRIGHSPINASAGTGLPTESLEAIISAKVAAAEKSINDNTKAICEERDDVVGQMIDEIWERINASDQGPAKHAELVARVELLEQWKAISSPFIHPNRGQTQTQHEIQNQTLNPNQPELARLEGLTVGRRVERIDHDVDSLNQKYEGLKSEVGKLVSREWVDLRLRELLAGSGMNAGVADDVKGLQRKVLAIDALEQAIKTLEWQYQNLSTKGLAEQIVRLTNPALEQRLVKVEARTSQLENASITRTVMQQGEQLASITALLHKLLPIEKRTASPTYGDEPNKKRKLEVNGRYPSPLQRQQQQQQQQQGQQNSPAQHPSS